MKSWNCKSSLSNKENYVGIIFNSDNIDVYFPIGYLIPTDKNEQKNSIIELLRTISLCKNIGEYSNENYNIGDYKEIPINSYLWIINDYLNNGLYNIYEKRYVTSQNGKINFKRTFKTKSYFNDNGIVYLNPIVEKKKTVENIITDIQIYCLNESIDVMGWLFGDIIGPINRIDVKSNINYYLSIIEKEFANSFNDKKKILLHHLKKVILNLSDRDNLGNVKNIITFNYYHAFEKMVDEVYGNADILKYFPNSSWVISQEVINNSKLRPDTIIECGDKLYIVDSKYYKYGVDKKACNLPSTSSVEKQITYGEYAKNKGIFKEVYNAFVIPYCKKHNEFERNGNIEYIGFALSNWKNDDFNYENISLILIDMNYLFDCYFKKERKDTKLLIDSIEKVIEDKNKYNKLLER